MSGPKRNPDKLNTIGVVVVGICGAVMVYVTIVALQAFYMNDTAEMQANKDYGGMDQTAKGHKADEMRNITEAASNPAGGTYRIPIEHAMELVEQDAAKDPSHLVPALPPATKPTIEPQFGRPKMIGGPAPEGAPAGAAPAGAAPAGAAPAGAPGGPAPTAGVDLPSPAKTATGAGGPGGAGASPGPSAAQPTAGNPTNPTTGQVPTAAPAGAGAGSAAQPKAPAQPKGAGAGSAAAPKGAGAAAQPKGAGSAAH